MEKLTAIILMAGLSTRFGGPKNKSLALLNGKPLFSYSIETFAKLENLSDLVLVVNEENKEEIKKFLGKTGINAKIIIGGTTRQASVENALKTLNLEDNNIVVVHDGARPLVDETIINKVARAASMFGAATAYLPATDTIVIKNEQDDIMELVERESVALVQTPQAFRYSILKKAHDSIYGLNATDDCSLVMRLGNTVKLIKGDKKYHKVTTVEDIKYLEGLLK